MVIAGFYGAHLAAAYNYQFENYSWAGSARSRSGKLAASIRDLHYWLTDHVSDGLVVTAIVALFAIAVACFVTLPVLALRWQKARDAHADAVAAAEASLD